jgi:hypothetical protein
MGYLAIAFGGQMDDHWYGNITESDEQAIFLRDVERSN